MIVQAAGGAMLVMLMRCDRQDARDPEDLLFEAPEDLLDAAADVRAAPAPFGSVPNTAPQ